MCRCLIVVCARLCGAMAGRAFLAPVALGLWYWGRWPGFVLRDSHTLWFLREECLSELASWSWAGSFRYFL